MTDSAEHVAVILARRAERRAVVSALVAAHHAQSKPGTHAMNETTNHETVGDVLAEMRASPSPDVRRNQQLDKWAERIERAHARESAAQVGVPEGWALVPSEPTQAMLTVLRFGDNIDNRKTYSALLSAAPAPAAEPAHTSSEPHAATEREMEKLIGERDRVESVLDKVLDHVLGADRREWSSAYGYDDAVDDVEDRMAELAPATPAEPDPKPAPSDAPASPQAAQGDVEALARGIGETDRPPTEEDRIGFEAWMRGHCWKVEGQWNGAQYVHETEGPPTRSLHQGAMLTRRLFAAWRDRGELARRLASAQPNSSATLTGSAVKDSLTDADLSELDRAIETLRRDDEHGLYDGLCDLRKRLTGGSHD